MQTCFIFLTYPPFKLNAFDTTGPRSGIFFTRSNWMGLDIPPCFIDLQDVEQEGVVPPNLSSFGKKIAYMVTLFSFLRQL